MSSAMYYIAILVPTSINEQVLFWKHYMRDRFECIAALKSSAHISLVSPFWMYDELQSQLEESIQKFCDGKKKFSLQIKDFSSFPPRVIFLAVSESAALTQLKSELGEHLLMSPLFPIKKDARAFHPHITIANRDLQKGDFLIAWDYFKKKKYEASFMVTGISLMKLQDIQWETACTGRFPLV